MSGTSGQDLGTSGARLLPPDWRAATLLVALVGTIVVIVNATSNIIEAAQEGRDLDPRGPWVWESSSVLSLIALTPLAGLAWAPAAAGRL